MSGLCLMAGKLFAAIPVAAFTLVSSGSPDTARVEEEWRIEAGELRLLSTKSFDRDGDPVAAPAPKAGPVIRQWLRASADPRHQLCIDSRCRALSVLLPGIEAGAEVEIKACPDEAR